MPTTQEIEAFIRQNAGMPIQQGAGQVADVTEDKINQAGQAASAMKQAALAKLAGPQTLPQAPPQAPPIPNVQPNDPSMSPQDAQSRMGAMINAPLSGGTNLGLDGAAQARAAQLALNNSAAPASGLPSDLQATLDTARHQQIDQGPPQPLMRQFPQIHKRVMAKQPVTAQDIRSTIKPNEPLTDEQMEELDRTR